MGGCAGGKTMPSLGRSDHDCPLILAKWQLFSMRWPKTRRRNGLFGRISRSVTKRPWFLRGTVLFSGKGLFHHLASPQAASQGLPGRHPRYNDEAPRRGAGAVERGGLENRCGPSGHRGFESHPLRQLGNVLVGSPSARARQGKVV